jgi:proline dehydrogenase
MTSKLGPKNGDSGSASEGYKEISFNDTKIAFASKTAGDLLRAWLILYGCSFSSLVKRADYMYNLSLSVLGNKITHAMIERTLFRHFCAGKDENDIAKPIRRLQSYGVGGILDYAAEAKEEEASSKQSIEAEKLHLKTTAQARVHTYSSESKCDKNMEIFKHAVVAVHNVSPNGFAAVKLSALGEPALLERMSEALVEIEAFFGKLAASTPGSPTSLSYDQFEQGWRKFFNFDSETAVRAQFDKVDLDQDGEIDIVDWMSRLTLRDLPKLVSSCKDQGPLYQASLNESELEMMENFLRRVDEVCQLAAEKKVRVMIDAEWTAIQPAIDSVVVEMQRKYNTVMNGHPVVFHTYQTYLVGSLERIKRDLDRSRRENWQFGAKLVRGAYMVSERERAKRLGVPSPIWPTYKDTEDNYHAALDTLLKEDDTEVMVASHNERTVKFVLERMRNKKKVYFGQLLGMADHLTFTLAANQLQAYKYVPYGPVDEVMPYLIRRTQENSTLLGTPAVVNERKMLWSELMRRITPRL